MDDARQKIARAMSAAGEMRLALAGHVSFDVAARKWDDAAEDAHQAVCGLVAAETPDDITALCAEKAEALADQRNWAGGEIIRLKELLVVAERERDAVRATLAAQEHKT